MCDNCENVKKFFEDMQAKVEEADNIRVAAYDAYRAAWRSPTAGWLEYMAASEAYDRAIDDYMRLARPWNLAWTAADKCRQSKKRG